MSEPAPFYDWRLRAMRHRFRPRNRMGRSAASVAPWVDIVLLVLFFVLLSQRFVLRPGFVVELPVGDVASGSRYGYTAVILSRESAATGAREEIVFFDDDRFDLDDPVQRERLMDRLTRANARAPDTPLMVEADRRVRHGTLTHLYRMARRAGIRHVNLLTGPGTVGDDGP